MPRARDEKPVRLWLAACALLVACMVMLGGYTRLSGSGLSITSWRPIHGTLPPLSQAEWHEEFEAYKASPQYQQVNAGMDMDAFKGIFWPEYLHRLLGRLLGLCFFAPFCVFLARRSLSRRFALRLAAIFALGGLQGLVGWLMVASGLVDMPRVSHFRLAAHLTLAFLIFALIVWAFLDLRPAARPAAYPRSLLRLYQCWTAALAVQIVWGAFMAGLHAGHIYNTWPDFNGQLLPPDLASGAGLLADSATHIPMVQFIHRSLAVLLLLTVVIWAWLSRGPLQKSLAGRLSLWLLILVNVQFALGVATLLQVAPLGLAWLHQLVALALFAAALALLHALPRGKQTVRT